MRGHNNDIFSLKSLVLVITIHKIDKMTTTNVGWSWLETDRTELSSEVVRLDAGNDPDCCQRLTLLTTPSGPCLDAVQIVHYGL